MYSSYSKGYRSWISWIDYPRSWINLCSLYTFFIEKKHQKYEKNKRKRKKLKKKQFFFCFSACFKQDLKNKRFFTRP